MPWGDPNVWTKIYEEYWLLVLTLVGAALGRLFHWTNNMKRLPTWREFFVEVTLIGIVGMFWGGLLQYLAVEPSAVYGGVVAIGSVFGLKGIVKLINLAAKKYLGADDDICVVEDLIKMDYHKKDKK